MQCRCTWVTSSSSLWRSSRVEFVNRQKQSKFDRWQWAVFVSSIKQGFRIDSPAATQKSYCIQIVSLATMRKCYDCDRGEQGHANNSKCCSLVRSASGQAHEPFCKRPKQPVLEAWSLRTRTEASVHYTDLKPAEKNLVWVTKGRKHWGVHANS